MVSNKSPFTWLQSCFTESLINDQSKMKWYKSEKPLMKQTKRSLFKTFIQLNKNKSLTLLNFTSIYRKAFQRKSRKYISGCSLMVKSCLLTASWIIEYSLKVGYLKSIVFIVTNIINFFHRWFNFWNIEKLFN